MAHADDREHHHGHEFDGDDHHHDHELDDEFDDDDDDHDHGDEHDHHHDDHHDHGDEAGKEGSNGVPRRKKRLRNRPRLTEIDAAPFDDCSTMHVLVCKGFTGQIFRAQISAFDTVEESLPLLAEQVSYPFPDFEKIGLYNMTRDFEYLPHETFIETGTQEGDLLFMADGAACHKKA